MEEQSRLPDVIKRSLFAAIPKDVAMHKIEKFVLSTNCEKRFCTGSAFYGDLNPLGMTGKGVYRYTHGVIYDGNFNRSGEFHGAGTLIYPSGHKVEGFWRNGKLVDLLDTSFADYCKSPDRRFQIEKESEIMPAGQEILTNEETPRQIPKGMYDTPEGFYNPKNNLILGDIRMATKSLFDNEESEKIYDKLEEGTLSDENLLALTKRTSITNIPKINYIPTEMYQKWITKYCRKDVDEPVGYRPKFYETWNPGYRSYNVRASVQSDEIKTLIMNLCNPQDVGNPKRFVNKISFIGNKKKDFLPRIKIAARIDSVQLIHRKVRYGSKQQPIKRTLCFHPKREKDPCEENIVKETKFVRILQ